MEVALSISFSKIYVTFETTLVQIQNGKTDNSKQDYVVPTQTEGGKKQFFFFIKYTPRIVDLCCCRMPLDAFTSVPSSNLNWGGKNTKNEFLFFDNTYCVPSVMRDLYE